MKPKEKEALVRSRPALLRSLEVPKLLPWLRQERVVSSEEEAAIMADPRRRRQVTSLLDLLEKKKSEGYQVFLDALEERYPHLYLTVTEGEPVDPNFVDEWEALHRIRRYLIEEIDAAKIMPYMVHKEVIGVDEEKQILDVKHCGVRTEAFLDILELKSPTVYDDLLEAIGEMYPHVYLNLTGQIDDDDDDDDLF